MKFRYGRNKCIEEYIYRERYSIKERLTIINALNNRSEHSRKKQKINKKGAAY